MSWRTVVISSSAKLDCQVSYLVVRKETTVKIHLGEIGLLMLESTAVSLTAALLAELTRRKIKVIFCDEKRNPSSELVPYYGAHNTSAKIRSQIEWPKETKLAVWTGIVGDKILKQSKTLRFFHRPEAELLEEYLENLEFGDATNREGHAAKVYFNALFGKQFTRTDDSVANAALNYGYGILLSAFNREITASGYLTQLGLFHDNMFNPFNLASDLMEPFRVLVDREVCAERPEQFGHAEKMRMINLLNQEVIIGNRMETVNNAIKIYSKSVFDALEEMDVSLIKYYQEMK